jgi:uncharacterized protein YlxP (DUF503 family)
MSAVVGCLYLELFISEAQSLKDKRKVVKSLKDRMQQKFPVATAEIGETGLWQRAELAVVSVSNEQKQVDRVLATLADWVTSQAGFVVSAQRLEWR